MENDHNIHEDYRDIIKDSVSLEQREKNARKRCILKIKNIDSEVLKRIDIFEPPTEFDTENLVTEILNLVKNDKKNLNEINDLSNKLLFNRLFQDIYECFGKEVYHSIVQKVHLYEFHENKTIIKYLWNSEDYYIVLKGKVIIKTSYGRIYQFNSNTDFSKYILQNRSSIIKKTGLEFNKDGILTCKIWKLEDTFLLNPLDGFGDFVLHNKRNMYY